MSGFKMKQELDNEEPLLEHGQKKGTRPRLVRQQQFEYAYLFGAVCPSRNEAVGLVLPCVNTQAMLVHLEHLSAKVPKGRHAVIVLDQAAWHTTKRLKKFDNLSLLPLPPVSPELNPMGSSLVKRCHTGL